MASQYRVDVHHRRTPGRLEGNDLHVLEQRLDLRAIHYLGGSYHDILASLAAAPSLVEHAERLTHTGHISQENLQPAPLLIFLFSLYLAQQ
jgi:hypothetical protein